jgi:polysaccharide biosynthesis transport protein
MQISQYSPNPNQGNDENRIERRRARPMANPLEARPMALQSSLASDLRGFVRENAILLGLGTALGLLLAWIYTGTQIPQYRATATLEIQDLNENFLDREVSKVSPFAQSPVANDIQTQLRILQSRSLLGRTAAALPTEKIPAPRGLSVWLNRLRPAPAAVVSRDALTERAAQGLQVRETRQSRIVDLSFESPDPTYAAAFANALAQRYIEQSIEARLEISRGTSEFLEKQLSEAGAKMAASELKLQEYARQSGLLVTSAENRPDEERFRQIQESLSKAQENRMSKQARMETAASAPMDSLDIPLGSALREFQTKLAELRRQRADLITVYTPDFEGIKRLDAQIARLEAEQRKESTAILQNIRNDYNDALRRERLLESSYQEQFAKVTEQAGIAIQYGILKRAVDTNRELYNNLLQRTAEAKIASALRASGARVVDPATTPRLPFKPSRILNLLWGASGGVLLGLVLGTVRRVSRSGLYALREAALHMGIPELGSMPRITNLQRQSAFQLWSAQAGFMRIPQLSPASKNSVATASWNNRYSAPANSFRSILASILLSKNSLVAPQVVVITSVRPREGKTTLVANLAAVLAHMGRRVLLVDASPNRRLHELLQAKQDASLQDSLLLPTDNSDVFTYVSSETIWNGVNIVHLGNNNTNAMDLLYSPGLAPILDEMRLHYDMVLIDAPSLDGLPDARVFGRVADGTILVSGESEEQLQAALLAADRLRQDGTVVLGTVTNQAE